MSLVVDQAARIYLLMKNIYIKKFTRLVSWKNGVDAWSLEMGKEVERN